MTFAELIRRDRAAIAGRWIDLVVHSYPEETAGFLVREEDPFANPSGHLIREAAGPLVDALCDDGVGADALDHLDRIVRLRSVQDLKPGQAVAVVPMLRRAVLDVLGASVRPFWLELVEGTERLTVAAFDVYCDCREQIFEARLHEKDRHFASLIRRAERIESETGREPTAASARRQRSVGSNERGEGE